MSQIVNSFTQFSTLKGVMVGRADGSCYPHQQPGSLWEPNDAPNDFWPFGAKPKSSIDKANAQLQNLEEVLSSECVTVYQEKELNDQLKEELLHLKAIPTKREEDARVLAEAKPSSKVFNKEGAVVIRPQVTDFNRPIVTPNFTAPNGYGHVCPRDSLITIGTSIVEATMSRRDRYHELDSLRPSVMKLWDARPTGFKWISAPRCSMADSMYDQSFWKLSDKERWNRMHHFNHCVNETEIVFDAADITRVGRDIFVQKSMTTNYQGIKWLQSTFGDDFRIHACHFPYDLAPSHIDCTFVPLRPPTAGSPGIVLANPDRPPLKEEVKLWTSNDWQVKFVPSPASDVRPKYSASSKWLSMNMLSLRPDLAVIEECELPLAHFLEEECGVEPLGVPFRHVFEFGGAIHCATWDFHRDDEKTDYFPNQDFEYCATPAEWGGEHPHFDSINVLKEGDIECFPQPEVKKDTVANGTDPKEFSRTYKDEEAVAGHFNLDQVKGTSGWDKMDSKVTDDVVRIGDMPVMESWEKPYMRHLADVTSKSGGKVLEIGFGLGLSGTMLQEAGMQNGVTHHYIIEAHPEVYKKLVEFKEHWDTVPGAPKVVPIFGQWKDAITVLRQDKVQLDGILYDAYPNNPSEQHLHQFLFAVKAWEFLKEGGRLVYCNLTSIGVLRSQSDTWEELWQETQLPYLTDRLLGLEKENCSYTIFEFPQSMIDNRGTCEYYSHSSALVPLVIKPVSTTPASLPEPSM